MINYTEKLPNQRFGYAGIFQEIGNVETFICEFKQRSRYDLYSLFKVTLTPEMYITDPSFALYRRLLEQGRYTGIARNLRFRIVCNKQQIEDQYHFIMMCPILVYHNLRT